MRSTPAGVDLEEVSFRYTLFTQHLDEDEDLQISRAANVVVVSGTASSEERLRQLQTALGNLSAVRLSISAPAQATGGAAFGTSQGPANTSSVPLLKDRLNSAFPTVAGRRDFVDSCLSFADSALSHAFALKKLADRYTDPNRRALQPESQNKLDEMLRGHLDQIAAANTKLNTLLDVLPPPQTKGAGSVTPRASVAALFDLVQRQDSLVAALVVGTQTTDTAVAAADKFRGAHDAITRLAGELRP